MNGSHLMHNVSRLLLVLAMIPACTSGWVFASTDVTTDARRYSLQESSSGYYEDDIEVMPHKRTLPGSPANTTKRTGRYADVHRLVKDYSGKIRCTSCHVNKADNLHTVRGNITCRQCHGLDPIAGADFYYAPMNSIRKHAYVCAKCHQGATPSFATFVVHTPAAGDAKTRSSFPTLYYSHYLMLFLIIGVFVVFLPHSILWWIRDWLMNKRRGK